MKHLLAVFAACACLAGSAAAQNYPNQNYPNQQYPSQNRDDRQYNGNGSYPDHIPAGTQIKIRTNSGIDVRERSDGRIYTGVVTEDVLGSNNNVMIPRGSNAELTVTNTGNNDLSVDLESITVRGRRYMVNASSYNRARQTGVGANKRTGEFVGGGALLGTVIGAIAGGGKGAAIGALAGAGAGAGGQVLTRGKAVNVPAESVLSFRLDQPLDLGRGNYTRDNGYDRNGNHYHDNYYGRNGNEGRNGYDREGAPPPPPPQQ